MSEPLPTFVDGHQQRWQELGSLVASARGSVAKLDPVAVRNLGRLYRQAVADLAYARRCYPKDPVTVRLDELVRQARPLLYGSVRERTSVLHFVTTGYWQRVAERPLILLASVLLLFAPVLIVGAWADANPEAAARVAQVSPLTAGIAERGPRNPDTQKVTDTGINVGMSGEIFTNNARAALTAFAGGLTAGVLTIAALVFNGLLLGLVAGLAIHGGNAESLWRLIVPHGVLELSLLAASGAAGLRTGWALVHPGHRTRVEALTVEGRAGIELALGSAALLVPCGIVEGFVTPRGLSVPAALTVGFGLGAVYWGLVLWRGVGTRRATAEPLPSA
ncbi:MAG: protein of unknown function transrane [Acidimicrobiales bacterium]|nr:protein of unknown function transrane [Acidimicrobiales bacterium]